MGGIILNGVLPELVASDMNKGPGGRVVSKAAGDPTPGALEMILDLNAV